MADPWERRPNESVRAYQAFEAYRSLGPNRSIDRAWRHARGIPDSPQRAPRRWQVWSRRWEWVARVAAWDAEEARKRREAEVDAIRAMCERHVAIALELQAKALARLESLDPDTLTPREVMLWTVEAAKLERLARGMAKEHVAAEHTGEQGGPLEIVFQVLDDGGEPLQFSIEEWRAVSEQIRLPGGPVPAEDAAARADSDPAPTLALEASTPVDDENRSRGGRPGSSRG